MKGTLGSMTKPASLRILLARMQTLAKIFAGHAWMPLLLVPRFLHFDDYYAVLADMWDLLELL
jgi:hypothetical protein